MHPQIKIHITQNKHKNKASFSRLLQHPTWKQSGTILVQWEGMESKKIDKASIKGKKES